MGQPSQILKALMLASSSSAVSMPDPRDFPTVAHGVIELTGPAGKASGLCLSSRWRELWEVDNYMLVEPCDTAVRWRYVQWPNTSKHYNYSGLGALMTDDYLVMQSFNCSSGGYPPIDNGCDLALTERDHSGAAHSAFQVSTYDNGRIEEGQPFVLWDYRLNWLDSFHEYCLVAFGEIAADTPVGIWRCNETSEAPTPLSKEWVWRSSPGPSPPPPAPVVVATGTIELANDDGSGTGLCMSAQDGDAPWHGLLLEACDVAMAWQYEDLRWCYPYSFNQQQAQGAGILVSQSRLNLDCGCEDDEDPPYDGMRWFLGGTGPAIGDEYCLFGGFTVSNYHDGGITSDVPMMLQMHAACLSVANDAVANASVVQWNCTGPTDVDGKGHAVSAVRRQWIWRSSAHVQADVTMI